MVTVYVSNLGTDDYTVDGDADQVQINQALTYANTNGTQASPVTVYLRGPYTYDLTDNLLAGSNTIFTGDTTAVLRLHNSAGWALWKPLIGQISGVTPQNFTFTNITVDGNYANQPEFTAGNWGDGYYPGLFFQGTLANPVRNISIHDALFKGTLTDGVRLSYADSVNFYNNKTVECMHEGIYVLRSKNCNIYSNDFTIRTNSGPRIYNSQNVKIYNNTMRPYALNSVAGNFGIQIEDNPSNKDITLYNVDVYGNTLVNCWGGGIWLIDLQGTSTNKAIKIHDNTITGCGRITTTNYNAGITIQGLNGVEIYNNVLKDNYNAGILIANAPSGGSGYTYYYTNNVVSGTLDTLATSSTNIKTGHGFGVVNRVPASVSVIATNNIVSANANGDYYQVSNLNDVQTTPPVKVVPAIRINEIDEIVDYYIPGYVSYVNGYPVLIRGFEPDTDESIGTDKPPGWDGWVLGDFGSDGTSINFRCHAMGKDDYRRAVASWKKKGRAYVEIGEDPGWQVSGIVRNHNHRIDKDAGDIMGDESAYDYNVSFYSDSPFEETVNKHVRARKLTFSGEQWSADNTYAGNILANPSFEEWTKGVTQTWIPRTSASSVDFKAVEHSEDLSQYCAVAQNSIQISSDAVSWSVPGTLPANISNAWKGLIWGETTGIDTAASTLNYIPVSSDGYIMVSSDNYTPVSTDLSEDAGMAAGRWVAVGYTAGTAGAAWSVDGDSWTAGVTPTGNFEDVCYIRDDKNGIYRYVAVGNNLVIYSDDGGETWSSVVVSGSFKAVCYSTTLKRLLAVTTSGEVIYSDNFAENWEAVTAPSQAWQDVIYSDTQSLFIVISSDGGPQQVMTSPTGLSGSWTLQNTPIAGSIVTPGEGDISTDTRQTDAGYVYTSAAMVYSSANTSLEWTYVLPALTDGSFYRLDRVFGKLRTLLAGKIAYLKVTIHAASLYSGVETDLIEWTNNTTTYSQKFYDLAIESETSETVTIRFYMKTSDSNYRAAATDLGFTFTVAGETGGEVSYLYNEWSAISEAPDSGIIVAVASAGEDNQIMTSINAGIWNLQACDKALASICYSESDIKFVTCGASGAILTSSDYGRYANPDGWAAVNPGTSRSENSTTGTYALLITGDGSTDEPGMITQPVAFEGGVTYALTGEVEKVGSDGIAVIDIYANEEVIASLEWANEGTYSEKQEYIKFEVSPVGAVLRIHGSETPSAGTLMYFDHIVLQKLSDLDIDEFGSGILTSGTVETVPDISIESMGTLAGSVEGKETPGNSKTNTDLTNVGSTVFLTYQLQDFFNYTISGVAGKKYRIDKVGIKGCVAASGGRCDSKIEVYLGSTLAGTYTFSSTSVLASYTSHSATPNIICEAGQSISFKWYLKSSSTSIRAYIRDATVTYTEILSTPTVNIDAGISVFNIEDPLTVMRLSNRIFPGVKTTIAADGTGSYRYLENFKDSSYQSAVLSRTGDSFNESLKQVLLSGNLVWEFDTLYPITGIPWMNIYVVSGVPKLEISVDNVTWRACDSNNTTSITGEQVTRELDNAENLRLYGKTRFYVRLSPASGNLTIGSISLFTYLITIDAEHPVISANGEANTFQVNMSNNVPCIVSMKYPDKHWI